MDISTVEYVILLTGAMIAGLVSAICGFGGGILFLPAVVAIVGPRVAVPLITFGLLFSNLSRLLLLIRHVNWGLATRYILGAVPGAVIGAMIFVKMPTGLLTRSIGVFLILAVILRRLEHIRIKRSQRWIFTPVGAMVGLLSAIWGAIGPAAVPFFLAANLSKESFVATLAIGAFAMHIAKTISYGRLELLNTSILHTGLTIGVLMMVGTWLGKQVLVRTTPRVFLLAVDGLLVVLGVYFLIGT